MCIFIIFLCSGVIFEFGAIAPPPPSNLGQNWLRQGQGGVCACECVRHKRGDAAAGHHRENTIILHARTHDEGCVGVSVYVCLFVYAYVCVCVCACVCACVRTRRYNI